MTFGVFVFVGIVWLSNGSVQPPIARTEPTRAKCESARLDFESALQEINSESPPTMIMTYNAGPCKYILNTSDAKRS